MGDNLRVIIIRSLIVCGQILIQGTLVGKANYRPIQIDNGQNLAILALLCL